MAHRPRVQVLDGQRDCGVGFGQRRECPVAPPRQDPALDDEHRAFDLALVARAPTARRHDRGIITLGHHRKRLCQRRLETQRLHHAGLGLSQTLARPQSGNTNVSGSISRTGDALARADLFEAADVLVTRVKRWTALKARGFKLAQRIGINRARAAAARKMAVIMHVMLVAATDFRWNKEGVIAA